MAMSKEVGDRVTVRFAHGCRVVPNRAGIWTSYPMD